MPVMTYLPEVECSIVPGPGETEVTVTVVDDEGTQHERHVLKDFVTHKDEVTYVPIDIVMLDYQHQRARIELPAGMDGKPAPIWVSLSALRQEGDTMYALGAPGGLAPTT
jgi:hypothetical protein